MSISSSLNSILSFVILIYVLLLIYTLLSIISFHVQASFIGMFNNPKNVNYKKNLYNSNALTIHGSNICLRSELPWDSTVSLYPRCWYTFGKLIELAHCTERLFADCRRFSKNFERLSAFCPVYRFVLRGNSTRKPVERSSGWSNGQLIRQNSLWIALPFLETSHVRFLLKTYFFIVSSMI